MQNDNKQGGYEIGYGKPPRHTRFQKGQSGNFRGRPKGAKNFTTVAEEALREPIAINENGRRKTATKMEVIIKQLVNKAAKGDHRSTQLLMAYVEKHPLTMPASPTTTITELDEKVNLVRDTYKVLRDLEVPGVIDPPEFDQYRVGTTEDTDLVLNSVLGLGERQLKLVDRAEIGLPFDDVQAEQTTRPATQVEETEKTAGR
jgi:hypothetical protein